MRLTQDMASETASSGETIEFVVNPALVPALVGWLDSRGIDLIQGPPHEGDGEGALRWFIASPRSLWAGDES